MGYNKSLIFICLIVFLFSLSCVCASDINQTAVLNDESNQLDSDVLSESVNDMELEDSIKISSESNNDSILSDDVETKKSTVLVASDFTTEYQKNDHLYVTLTDNQKNPIPGVVLNVNLDGSKNFLTDVNGRIGISTSNLNVGIYGANISFTGNENYSQSSVEVKITVNKANSTLISNDSLILGYGNDVNMTVDTIGANGVTAKIGDMDVKVVENNKVIIPRMDAGTYILSVTTIPDENHNPVTKTTIITVNPVESSFSIRDVNITYGGSSKEKVFADWACEIIADIDGNNVSVDDGEILISGLDAGTYTLTVTAIGDKNHDSVTKKSTITVNKVDSDISIRDLNMKYGSSSNLTVSYSGSTAFTAKIDDESVNVVGNVIMIPKLDAGTYTLTVTTIPDKNHNSVTKTATITVNKIQDQFDIHDVTLNYGSDYNMDITTEANVKFIAKIDEKTVDVNRNSIIFPILDVGTHILTVSTVEDINHDSLTKTAKITVNKAKTDVITNDLTATAGQKIKLTAGIETVSLINEGIIVFYDGETKIGQANLDNGIATLSYTPPKVGFYSILVVYEGTSRYESSQSSFKLTVLGKSQSSNSSTYNTTIENKTSGSNSSGNDSLEIVIPSLGGSSGDGPFEINFPSDTTGNITLTVYGKDYVFDIVEGVASITLPELGNGDYSYIIRYSGDNNYSPFTTNGNLKINNVASDNPSGSDATKSGPEITIPPLDEPSDDGFVKVKLPSDATGIVTLKINNNGYNFTVVNGSAKIVIPNLEDGDYPYEIIYSGDGKYSSFTNTASLKVNKTAETNMTVTDYSKISASNIKVTYGTGKYYTIKIYDSHGKLSDGAKVVITVKGKIFKTLTTKNGIAKFKVTNAPGTYKMNITALGKSAVKTLTVKHLITLKSVTAKNSAKKLVLTATLGKVNGKYLKNKKVTFKFNGKKYTAKTDKKGVAKVTVKSSVLKKLKVGKKVTYQATYMKDTVKKTAKIKK